MYLIIFIIALLLLYKHYVLYPIQVGKVHLSVFFGIPGAGKTTIATRLAMMYQAKNIPVFSNVPIKGCYQYDALNQLGVFSIEHALVIVDEASIEYNSRSFKTFPKHLISWYKKHRHEHCEVAIFSQDYQDFDATIKRLAYKYYLCRPSLIPYFVEAVPIKRKFGINDQTHKPDDLFSLHSPFTNWFFTRYFFAPVTWNKFNSWESLNLPKKKWVKYSDSSFEKPKKYKKPLLQRIKPFFMSRKYVKTMLSKFKRK